METQGALGTVMGDWVVLGCVVGKVASTRFPKDGELAFFDAVLKPIEAHVDSFGAALFDRLVEDAARHTVVGDHDSGWLGPAHLTECGAERAQGLGIVESPPNLSIGSRGVDILHDAGKDMDGPIERGH